MVTAWNPGSHNRPNDWTTVSHQFTTPANTAAFRAGYTINLSRGWLSFREPALTGWTAAVSSGSAQPFDLSFQVRGELIPAYPEHDYPLGGRTVVQFYNSADQPLGATQQLWNGSGYTEPGWTTKNAAFVTAVDTATFRLGYTIYLDRGWLAFQDMTLTGWSAPITSGGNQDYDLAVLVAGQIEGQGGHIQVHYNNGSSETLWQNMSNYNSQNGTVQNSSFTTPPDATGFQFSYRVQLEKGWLSFAGPTLTGWSAPATSLSDHYWEQYYNLATLVTGQMAAGGGRIRVHYKIGENYGPWVTLWQNTADYNSSGAVQGDDFSVEPADISAFRFSYERHHGAAPF